MEFSPGVQQLIRGTKIFRVTSLTQFSRNMAPGIFRKSGTNRCAIPQLFWLICIMIRKWLSLAKFKSALREKLRSPEETETLEKDDTD